MAFISPQVCIYWLVAPISIVQGFYAKHYGLPLTVIAKIVLIAMLFDAISDPLIGYWSDRYRRQGGSRKPFILAGSLVFIVAGYFLYIPPMEVTALYFAACLISVYFGYTLFEVPHVAWASELAPTANDKTYIYSLRSIAGYMGMLLFYAAPLLPLFDSNEITPQTLKFSVLCSGLLLLPMLVWCLRITPNDYSGTQTSGLSGFKDTRLQGNTSAVSIGLRCLIGSLCSNCLLYTSPSPRDQRGSRMPSSA